MEKTVVCLACFYKGYDFMDEMHALGNKVILITSENLREKAWPWHAIKEVFYMPENAPSAWNLSHLVQGFAYLLRHTVVDAVVALDDYDVEKAALLRETFRIPGMGQSTQRYFRDKLAMRQIAERNGIDIPQYTAIFNDEAVQKFTAEVAPPWMLKPRSEASASGIKKINSTEELWHHIGRLGEERHLFLLESYKPGTVFHVDAISYRQKVKFSCCSAYLAPPLDVSRGGVFRTRTLDSKSVEHRALSKLNAGILQKFGLMDGASHSEFILGEDGVFYFLETSCRVGGAHISDMVEAATGVNLWREWARVEHAVLNEEKYTSPKVRKDYGGLLIALAKEKHPETEQFRNEETAKFLSIDYHIGIVYQSKSEEKILQRLNDAGEKVAAEILNVLPPRDKTFS